MNKMAKGAIATAAGVVLLIGGGGTLALWETRKDSDAGQIVAGSMEMTTQPGVWSIHGVNAQGEPTTFPIADISTYKIVPGDTLTYSQQVSVDLEGENLAADLDVFYPTNINGFDTNTVDVSGVQLKNGDLEVERLTEDATVTASVEFEFLSTTGGSASARATYNFNDVAFVLKQAYSAPTAAPSAS